MIAVLVAAIVFTIFLFIYFYRRQTSDSDFFNLMGFLPIVRSWRSPATVGLDPVIIETFPTMIYSDVKSLMTGNSPLECAVCICEFEDEEELTLLPKCDHAFHPQCISMWLASHTTCPVCRGNLAAPPWESFRSEFPVIVEDRGRRAVVEEEGMTSEDHVAMRVGEDELGWIGRSRRSLSNRIRNPWRSSSARPAVERSIWSSTRIGEAWEPENSERYSLRLPESIRKELIAGAISTSLRRPTSVTVGVSSRL